MARRRYTNSQHNTLANGRLFPVRATSAGDTQTMDAREWTGAVCRDWVLPEGRLAYVPRAASKEVCRDNATGAIRLGHDDGSCWGHVWEINYKQRRATKTSIYMYSFTFRGCCASHTSLYTRACLSAVVSRRLFTCKPRRTTQAVGHFPTTTI